MESPLSPAVTDFVAVREVEVSAYRVPTATPESDGTLDWDQTTLVLVELEAGDVRSLGYTYGHPAIGKIISSTLTKLLIGRNVFDIPSLFHEMTTRIRNEGECGLAMMAVSAVDISLWDAKARLLGQPLCQLLGKARESMPVYGSGGFTSYSDSQMTSQLEGWMGQGIEDVKIKIGRQPEKDLHRVKVARKAIGEGKGLFVDANGAFTVPGALSLAHQMAGQGVEWFEEPVCSDDLQGLHRIRSGVPPGMRIAAGEYGYNPWYFRHMLEAGAVDVLQADATRCGGITGFLQAASLANAAGIPFSSHCAPAIHLHPALSCPSFYMAEYFFDHTRIESLLFEGSATACGGAMSPDPQRPGLGLEFREGEGRKYKI